MKVAPRLQVELLGGQPGSSLDQNGEEHLIIYLLRRRDRFRLRTPLQCPDAPRIWSCLVTKCNSNNLFRVHTREMLGSLCFSTLLRIQIRVARTLPYFTRLFPT